MKIIKYRILSLKRTLKKLELYFDRSKFYEIFKKIFKMIFYKFFMINYENSN